MSCPSIVRHLDGAGPENSVSLGSALCTQCGLCCTGAIHDNAVLEPEEIEFARRLGLALRTEGRPGFGLPCPKLQGSVCSIYRDRPRVCGRYKCQLLSDVEAGATTLEEAVGRVAVAKELVLQAEALIPEGMVLPRARALALGSPSIASGGHEAAFTLQAKLAVTALCFYVDKHFKNGRERKLLSLQPVDGEITELEMI